MKVMREKGDERIDKLQVELRQLKEIIENKNH